MRNHLPFALVIGAMLLLAGILAANAERAPSSCVPAGSYAGHRLLSCVWPTHAAPGERASWYGEGQMVACGGRFRPDGLTAASRSLPCGARVRVTNRANGRSVEVTINDYGPAKWTGRSIDLSRGAARVLGMIEAGTAAVSVERMP